MSTPHDILFRRVFGRVGNARDLLRSALPSSIARKIQWRSLRRIEGSFVDKKLRRYYTDLLFSAKIGRRRVLIYVLVEHKSGNYRLTALQILGYAHAIWTRHHRDHPHERLLPPILPFVLHHGERAFTSPTNLRELIDLRGLPAELVALQPDVRFVLDDLATQTEAQLRDRVASTFAQLALLCMQQLRTADAAGAEAMLRSWAALTEQLADAKNGQDDLLALLSYILQIGCLPEARMHTVHTDIARRTAKAMLTTAQQIGRRIDREKGPNWLRQGQAAMLLLLITKKFGPPQKTIVTRVRRARSAQLGLWAERFLTATTLDGVFAK